ncbi:cupin domain-containing protein, partial [Pediococcus acidilactici]
MQLKHELIRRVGYLLFHAFTFKARNLKRVIPQHWHQSTEIIYCLSGKLNVWINQNLYVMGCGDILVINSNTIHSTQSPCPNHVLCIQLPLPLLQTITENQYLKSFSFDLNTTQASSLQFKKLQKILNDITKIVDQDIAD